ncbi:hypothetical protein AMATHDRAFT_4543 [Amanita thiersii Skay4041]|uniref:Uncharacterized protein n=1 Tax=Amanita thiersii Skay4041 TaxID=703135 RepID=A0A2A9NQ97_9AGAR|nr:hypothetical protein AMATHDRAFT_4543 [Amanita thiersii Skay4041]
MDVGVSGGKFVILLFDQLELFYEKLKNFTFQCNMLAALGKGRDILQKVLQEGSGGDGLNESIGGGFQNWNLEVMIWNL